MIRLSFRENEWLTSGRALLCANDRLALGAIEALRERGIDCPRQGSVTGFNDVPSSA
jgi:LacI family transcriptional regulator